MTVLRRTRGPIGAPSLGRAPPPLRDGLRIQPEPRGQGRVDARAASGSARAAGVVRALPWSTLAIVPPPRSDRTGRHQTPGPHTRRMSSGCVRCGVQREASTTCSLPYAALSYRTRISRSSARRPLECSRFAPRECGWWSTGKRLSSAGRCGSFSYDNRCPVGSRGRYVLAGNPSEGRNRECLEYSRNRCDASTRHDAYRCSELCPKSSAHARRVWPFAVDERHRASPRFNATVPVGLTVHALRGCATCCLQPRSR
jgi:hypothetical protein